MNAGISPSVAKGLTSFLADVAPDSAAGIFDRKATGTLSAQGSRS
jgi:hypothetical protein